MDPRPRDPHRRPGPAEAFPLPDPGRPGHARPGTLTALLAALTVACAAPPAGRDPPTGLAARLQAALEHSLAGPAAAPGALLRVDAPRLHLSWSGAVETAPGAQPIDAGGTLHVASITKSVVAAGLLRLAEAGRIGLDRPIGPLLRPTTAARLAAAGHDPWRLTPRMLLQHTGGLPDHATDPAFLARVLAEPRHRWTRDEQIDLALARGGPLAPPGAAFHYSDTGYLLLAETLETATGRPMPQALRDLLGTRRLGLRHTWFDTLEPAPRDAPPRVAQHFDDRPLSAFDPSIDLYGGGGLVSTLPELTRLFRALVRGEVFENPGTATRMATPSPQSLAAGTAGYGMGLARLVHAGVTCHGHHGFWGLAVWHCPAIDVTIAAAVTSTRARPALTALVHEALDAVAAATASRHGGRP